MLCVLGLDRLARSLVIAYFLFFFFCLVRHRRSAALGLEVGVARSSPLKGTLPTSSHLARPRKRPEPVHFAEDHSNLDLHFPRTLGKLPKQRYTATARAGNDEVLRLLRSDKVFVAARLSYKGAEAQVAQAMILGNTKSAGTQLLKDATINAGIYPMTQDGVAAYAKELSRSLAELTEDDLIAAFDYSTRPNGEIASLESKLSRAKVYPNRFLEPWYFPENPWSSALAGKTVLVIAAMVESFRCQMREDRRPTIWSHVNSSILPEFSIKYVPSVQSCCGLRPHASWTESLKVMQKAIDAVGHFDVALVAAGAYGFPLAAYCRRKHNRSAIVIGGGLQLLFGVKGNRWEKHPIIRPLFGSQWIYPLLSEVPKQANLVEGACYWGPKALSLEYCPATRGKK
ncbi:unnamed protein product [Amoebophrya sp. A120]|nr:unnamed protein product [Amoebophrya sp. A120]|eukprot:GSA120T00020643001.1